MAHISYRANLSAAIFPLTYNNVGGTVIVPQADNNYDRRVDPAGEQKTAGIPQAIFLENVLPTEYGYQSVGFEELASISLLTGEYVTFAYLANNNFVAAQIQATTPKWAVNQANADAPWQYGLTGNPNLWNTLDFDTAYVRGYNYGYIPASGYGGAKILEGGLLLWEHWVQSAPFTGYNGGYLLASHNYLLGITQNTGEVQWSSTTTPTDFTPSLVSGAGSIIPNDFKSPVVALRNTAEGFIMYCGKNAIAATYTGNARYPWKFREIRGAFGYNRNEDIAGAKGAEAHYAIDAQKTLRVITSDSAQQIAPEVSTWLRGQPTIESWNASGYVQVTSLSGAKLRTWLRYIMNRYLFLSYVSSATLSTAEYTHVLVYDTLLQRYGRLKVDHTFVWDYDGEVYFLTRTGITKRMSFDLSDSAATHDSTLVLGKFQYVRSRHLDLHNVRTEHGPDSNYTVGVISSLDGATAGTYQALTASTLGAGINEYDCRLTGMNHQIVIRGKFDLNTLALTFSPGAGR
jgi:hypothetical protein